MTCIYASLDGALCEPSALSGLVSPWLPLGYAGQAEGPGRRRREGGNRLKSSRWVWVE